VPRKKRETHQQEEQIAEDHPLVRHVTGKAGQAGAELEAGEDQLVQRDRHQAGQRHLQSVVVE
jgi:hypothetical protein